MMKKIMRVTLILALLAALNPFSAAVASATVNMQFEDEDIRVILQSLAILGDADVVIDESVKGKLSMRLTDISLDRAFELVTSAKGLSYRKSGNVYLVEPVDSNAVSEIIKLNHIRVVDVAKQLAVVAGSYKGKIEMDEGSNGLIYTGTPAGLARIRNMLNDMDQLQQQVELEAQVVSIQKSKSKDLGIDWIWGNVPKMPTYEEGSVSIVEGTTIVSPGKTTRTSLQEGQDLPGVIRFGKASAYGGRPFEFQYQAKLNALVSNGDAKILARPRVSTVNGREARILVGDRIPTLVQQVTNGATVNVVQYIEAGIKLIYTPTVNVDGNITAKVRTEVSTPVMVAEMKNYRISTREAESNIRMKDGETIVIAGLIGSQQSQGNNKVPFLSDLPILGALFKSVHSSNEETEVMVFLTARINKK